MNNTITVQKDLAYNSSDSEIQAAISKAGWELSVENFKWLFEGNEEIYLNEGCPVPNEICSLAKRIEKEGYKVVATEMVDGDTFVMKVAYNVTVNITFVGSEYIGYNDRIRPVKCSKFELVSQFGKSEVNTIEEVIEGLNAFNLCLIKWNILSA